VGNLKKFTGNSHKPTCFGNFTAAGGRSMPDGVGRSNGYPSGIHAFLLPKEAFL
jgi:hypothetical protein